MAAPAPAWPSTTTSCGPTVVPRRRTTERVAGASSIPPRGGAVAPDRDDLPGLRLGAVEAWCRAQIPGLVGPLHATFIAGGHSNLTYLVTDRVGQRLVLRRP